MRLRHIATQHRRESSWGESGVTLSGVTPKLPLTRIFGDLLADQ